MAATSSSSSSFLSRSLSSSRLFDKVLIANRGEVACRIARTCRRLGIRTVAVYTTPDAQSMHVRMADEAVCLGDAAAAAAGDAARTGGYACAEAVLEACLRTRAQAVHPGYGFLSESATFARLLRRHGVVFVGPDATSIEVLGNKAAAKQLAQAMHIPCVTGVRVPPDVTDDTPHTGNNKGSRRSSSSDGTSARTAATRAEVLARCVQRVGGYPVVIKPVCGGGGRGMRVVMSSSNNSNGTDEHDSNNNNNSSSSNALVAAYDACRREAMAAGYGDEMLIEAYVTPAQHVEVQLLADRHGRVVSFAERVCSVQRRHQKLVEETPSSSIDAATRAAMTRAAVALARAAHYVGAGTVEFLVTPSHTPHAQSPTMAAPLAPLPSSSPSSLSSLLSSSQQQQQQQQQQPTRLPFYFVEVNTRLQVEHAVTEMVSGVDLVEAMLRVAAGQPLCIACNDHSSSSGGGGGGVAGEEGDEYAQAAQAHTRGGGGGGQQRWAMECRVYAEQPRQHFAASAGVLYRYVEPPAHLVVQQEQQQQQQQQQQPQEEGQQAAEQARLHDSTRGATTHTCDVPSSPLPPSPSSSLSSSPSPLLPPPPPPLQLRIDAGVAEGDVVTPHYDALLSKVVVCAGDRATCVQAMLRALDAYVIRGVAHNIALLRDVCAHELFARDGGAAVTTTHLHTRYPHGFVAAPLTAHERRVLCGATACVRVLRDSDAAAAAAAAATPSLLSPCACCCCCGSRADMTKTTNTTTVHTFVVSLAAATTTATAHPSSRPETTTTTMRLSVVRLSARRFVLRYRDDTDMQDDHNNDDDEEEERAAVWSSPMTLSLQWRLNAPLLCVDVCDGDANANSHSRSTCCCCCNCCNDGGGGGGEDTTRARAHAASASPSALPQSGQHILQFVYTDEVTYTMQMKSSAYAVTVLTPRQAAFSHIACPADTATAMTMTRAGLAHAQQAMQTADDNGTAAAAVAVAAAMPGAIVNVCVRVGDVVTAGAALVTLEAMKMRSDVVATCRGTVVSVHVRVGDVVDAGSVLVRIA